MPSRSVSWRRPLLALCALCALLAAYSTWSMIALQGIAGYTSAATGIAFVDRLTVSPGSAAAALGWRTGDRADLRGISSADRFRERTGLLLGERIELPSMRGSATRMATLVGMRHPATTWDFWVGSSVVISALLFATLFAWRRADDAEARTLSLTLVALSAGYFSGTFFSPWAPIDAVVYACTHVLVPIASALFVRYAMLFARPPSSARRVLAWSSYVCIAGAAVAGIIDVVGLWSGMLDPLGPVLSNIATRILGGVLLWMSPLLCAVATLRATRGSERARFGWAVGSLGTIFGANTVFYIAGLLAPTFFAGPGDRIAIAIVNVTYVIAPIGLAYSLLTRRLLDVGFAINRAAVFSGVSIVVIGTFIIVEFLLGNWLQGQSHTTNALVGAGLALALGLSARVVHTRVDYFVDNVFFRKRHDSERAIRRFAKEAPFITDASTLIDRTADTLDRYADASFVTIALDDGNGFYSGVSENDPAVVALRAHGEIVDLHTMRSALDGDLAYPIVARGRLFGALVLGPRRSGETYAPDESDAILQVAHSVGSALELLHERTHNARDTGASDFMALRDELHALTEELRTLPDAIAERLRGTT